MHRIAASAAFTLALVGCAQVSDRGDDPALIRNPTVPIGAIQRFEAAKFDGDWRVHASAGGDWALREFTVSGSATAWREAAGAATIAPRATGILQLTYDDGTQRDLWVVWTDPDHHTVALGNPEGDFGFIATRAGRFRADQVTAAGQVLDFNGYRTDAWEVRAR
ncbi:lipocalin family protein [uncultured Tateyamaria sp.]|uniref:lipocalin family protein n=1 Tax=uncultured Tateyamaria sp. TaxID=455651 RepID=UPI002636E852|nr:lipocalin family protein [uncultured Tateyamaria sp.]